MAVAMKNHNGSKNQVFKIMPTLKWKWKPTSWG